MCCNISALDILNAAIGISQKLTRAAEDNCCTSLSCVGNNRLKETKQRERC